MPRKILGQPVDESKWERAKARAAEEGHAGEYDYIMGIYKRMAHLGEYKKSGHENYELAIEKSAVDDGEASRYNVDMKLVIGTGFDEFRCGECNALLLRGRHLEKSMIEVKCRRCGTVNTN